MTNTKTISRKEYNALRATYIELRRSGYDRGRLITELSIEFGVSETWMKCTADHLDRAV